MRTPRSTIGFSVLGFTAALLFSSVVFDPGFT
jgi:hypothetical protein